MNVNRKMAIVTEINDSEKTCEGWFIYATEKRRRGEEEKRRRRGKRHGVIST